MHISAMQSASQPAGEVEEREKKKGKEEGGEKQGSTGEDTKRRPLFRNYIVFHGNGSYVCAHEAQPCSQFGQAIGLTHGH